MPDTHADDALKRWLRARLTGEVAQREWPALMRAAWGQLMDTPLEQVLPVEDVHAAVQSWLQPDRIADLVLPGVRAILPTVIDRMREDHEPSGRWVPEQARDGLRALAAEPALIHEDWVRALFQQKAVELVMADALYRGIRDFSTILPRIMLAMLPTSRLPGFGGASSLGKKLLEDLERRLEPEIKSFLAGGTQRALSRAADFAVKHMEDPAYVSMRRNMVDFVLSKTPSFHVAPLTQHRLDQLEPIARSVALHVAARQETRRIAGDVLARLLERWGQHTVREALAAAGVQSEPDFEAMGRAAWPSLRVFLAAPEVGAWLDQLVDELLAEHKRATGT